MAPRAGQVDPHVCTDVILRHPLALVIHEAEVVLRNGVVLVSSEAIPFQGFSVVLRHPVHAVSVHAAKTDLRASVPTRSSVSVGEVGDLVLLDHDPLAERDTARATAERLRTTVVATTIVAGRVVHDAR